MGGWEYPCSHLPGCPQGQAAHAVLVEYEGFPLALKAEQKQLWGAGRGARGTPVGSQEDKREEMADEAAISREPGAQPY